MEWTMDNGMDNGMEWTMGNGQWEWNGMGMEWAMGNGMEWNGMEWNGMGMGMGMGNGNGGSGCNYLNYRQQNKKFSRLYKE